MTAQPLCAWRFAAFMGLLTVVMGALVISLFPTTGYDVEAGYGSPVIAFEMARTPDDLISVFGPHGHPLQADRVAQMDRGNLFDFGFMIIYSLYMASFFRAAFTSTKNKIWLLFSVLSLFTGVMDATENIILLKLTANLQVPAYLDILAYPVWTKFLSIMLCIIAAGFYISKGVGIVFQFLGVLTVLSALTVVIAFTSPAQFSWSMGGGITIGWLLMLVYCFINSRAPSK